MATDAIGTPESGPLAIYAAEVLELLESTPEWTSETLDEIGVLAIRHGIAHTDRVGMFTRGPQPDSVI